MPVNCAAIPDTLLESELFGYEEGAFTGAAKGGKPGLFELANGGTLFLDEIGEISVHLQAKLLRALQDKRVRRLGSSRELPVNVRIVAAPNRDLEDMVRLRLFREDLYYRLNVIPLYLPPLRERTVNLVDGPEMTAEHIYLGRPTTATAGPQVRFETYQTLQERLAEVEQSILQETMKRFRSARRAGAVLGISHTSVLKKLRKYGLWPDKP